VKDGSGLEISAEIDGGNASKFRCLGRGHFSLTPRRDHLPIQLHKKGALICFNWCVQVANHRDQPAQVVLDVQIPRLLTDYGDGWERFIRQSGWIRRGVKWARIPSECVENLPETVRFFFEVRPHETVRLAYSPAWPYYECRNIIRNIVREHPDLLSLHEIGKSTKGRPIEVVTLCQEAVNRNRRKIVVAATPQPAETGVWGTHSVLRFLLGRSREAINIRQNFIVDFLPFTNPDGAVRGTCQSNDAGYALLLSYQKVAQADITEPQEARVIWDWLSERKPEMLLEYHFGFGTGREPCKPYIFSSDIYPSAKLKNIASTVDRVLIRISEGRYNPISAAAPEQWIGLMTFQVAQRLGALAYLYQSMYPDLQTNQRHSVKVFRTVVRAYLRAVELY